ncbi:MAG: sigma-54 dependent transcriptional regulator [Myxococcota bacterium]
MAHIRLLLVEDERAQREALTRYLEKRQFEVDALATGEDAVAALQEKTYAVLITDLRLPAMDGLDVVRRARQLDEDLGVLLITAYASLESAIEALRAGADDYLLKPLILEEVGRKVSNLIAQRALVVENVRLRRALQASNRGREIVAESTAMREVSEWIGRAATSRANVLITGETGTGKEVVARNIHRLGEHSQEPFLPVNLAAMPDTMMESELFGHERGAFTGAERRREGILRAAGSGSVFMDEIAELPIALQAKLLRAIEAGEVRPVGCDRAVPFDARILVATHRNLKEMVADGTFREDLYYRLDVLHIHVPPLRERPEDIPLLVRDLLLRRSTRPGATTPTVSAEAMRALCTHNWRGNVRELSNVLERASILADDGRLDIDHLPEDVLGTASDNLRLSDAVERFERAHIATVLRLCGGHREKAAEELGISPSTLYRRLERLQLKGFEVHRNPEQNGNDGAADPQPSTSPDSQT